MNNYEARVLAFGFLSRLARPIFSAAKQRTTKEQYKKLSPPHLPRKKATMRNTPKAN